LKQIILAGHMEILAGHMVVIYLVCAVCDVTI